MQGLSAVSLARCFLLAAQCCTWCSSINLLNTVARWLAAQSPEYRVERFAPSGSGGAAAKRQALSGLRHALSEVRPALCASRSALATLPFPLCALQRLCVVNDLATKLVTTVEQPVRFILRQDVQSAKDVDHRCTLEVGPAGDIEKLTELAIVQTAAALCDVIRYGQPRSAKLFGVPIQLGLFQPSGHLMTFHRQLAGQCLDFKVFKTKMSHNVAKRNAPSVTRFALSGGGCAAAKRHAPSALPFPLCAIRSAPRFLHR